MASVSLLIINVERESEVLGWWTPHMYVAMELGALLEFILPRQQPAKEQRGDLHTVRE